MPSQSKVLIELPQPAFIDYPQQRTEPRETSGSVLRDIVDHVPERFGDKYFVDEPVTWGHEATHAINSELRLRYHRPEAPVGGFYVLQGKAMLVAEPSFRKSQVARFVPASLRNMDSTKRYDLYVTGQIDWDNRPLYLWDEWLGAINGAYVGQAMLKEGVLGDFVRKDLLHGPMEMAVYSIAVAMATQTYQPAYANAASFKGALTHLLKMAMQVVRESIQEAPFASETVKKYHKTLQQATDAAEFRRFCRQYFGDDFANEVIFKDL